MDWGQAYTIEKYYRVSVSLLDTGVSDDNATVSHMSEYVSVC